MPKITKREVYEYGGVQYPTKEKAIDAWENEVDRFVRHKLLANVVLTPRDRNAIISSVMVNAKGLALLLNLEIEDEDQDR